MSFRCRDLVLNIVCALVVLGRFDPVNAQRPNAANDAYCGVRCFAFIIRNFSSVQRDLDQYALMNDSSFSGKFTGVSFYDLKAAFEREGIESLGVAARDGVFLQSKNPMIVHVGASKESQGHFVVVLPGGNSEWVRVWDAEKEIQVEPAWEFERRVSKGWLVVGTQRIELNTGDGIEYTAVRTTESWLTLANIGVAVTQSIGIVCLGWWFRVA